MPLPAITKSTVTLTIAAPCVVSWAAHGHVAGTPIDLTTTGTLPTPLVAAGGANSCFYVSSAGLNVNDFQVSTTRANADAGISISTASGTQSGVHTCMVRTALLPWDVTNAAVTFTAASPNITWTAHGLALKDSVQFGATAAPPAMLLGMNYWVSSVIDADTITISQSYRGTPITWSGAGAGVYGFKILNKLGEEKIQISTIALAVPITLTNVLVGSQVRVADGSNVELYNGVAGTGTVSFSKKFAGTAYGTARLAGYQEYKFTMIVDGSLGASAYISQVTDGTS
jgi:hypothetical protein